MLAKLGKYEIRGELGSGAMGVVYRAEDPRLGRLVALKTTNAEVASNPNLLKRFYREAQAAAKLTHPNIVTIYEIDEANGLPYIAMEFLEGENLAKMISERREVPILKKIQIVLDTCKGLDYAHQHGVVHRDVKPANIVVLTTGQIKIVDFGIARVGVSSMTRTGDVLGTVMYMSPEQVQGQTVDARSDVFSLGVVLYELLAYQVPFTGDDVPSILFKILKDAPQDIKEYFPQCPPALEQIVLRALAKDREERFQSAEEMAFDLQRIADALKRNTMDVYLEQGKHSLQVGNFTVAKESLQKVLEIDSNHQVAQNLLAEVRERMQSRQRVQKVEGNVVQAKEALQAEQYEDAMVLLDEVLRLEPRHEEALELKKSAVEQRDRSAKIRRHLERADKLAAEADFQKAKIELEAVLDLDPRNTTARMLIQSVGKEFAEQERHRQVRQFLEGARAQLAEKSVKKALELLERARELDPLNIEVEAMIQLVRSSEEKEDRRKLLVKRLAEIEENLGRGNLDQALAAADQALREFEDDPQVLRMHSQIVRRMEVHKKRSYVDEQLQAARDFVQKNQFSSALAVLERAVQQIPDDPRLSSYLKSVQETHEQSAREAVRREAIHKANEQVHAKNFDAAIEILEKSLSQSGQSAELVELLQFVRERQAEQQRQERTHSVLSRARTHLREHQYDEAVQVLERGQKELKSSEIETLLASAREQREEFAKRRKEIVAGALGLLGSGEAAKALALFEPAPKVYFKDEEFQRVYSQCRQRVDRDNFVRTATAQIDKCLAAEDISAAESLLGQALKAYPDESALLALRERVKEEDLRLQRYHLGKTLEEAQVAYGRMEYARANELLNSVEWEPAGSAELAARAKSLRQDVERRQREASVPLLDLSVSGKQRPKRPTKAVFVPTATKSKRMPLVSVLVIAVLAVAGVGTWYLRGRSASPGFVQLTAAPWGEVANVSNAKGEHLNITGQTPLEVALPPGRYVIELKNGKSSCKVEASVEGGSVSAYSCVFPEVKIDDLVQKVLAAY